MKTLKTLLLFFSIVALLLTITGCDTLLMTPEDKATFNETIRKGEKIVKEYVEENMPDYKVGKTTCVQDEPSGGLYGEPSVYSSTVCISKKDGSTFHFLCNTETGELFSDEYVDKIERELLKYFENIIDSTEYKKKFGIFPLDECYWLDYGSVLMLGDTTLEDVLSNENYCLTLGMYFFNASIENIHSIPDSFAEECKINDLNIYIITTTDEEYYRDCLNSWSISDPYDGGKNIFRGMKNGSFVVKSENVFNNKNAR